MLHKDNQKTNRLLIFYAENQFQLHEFNVSLLCLSFRIFLDLTAKRILDISIKHYKWMRRKKNVFRSSKGLVSVHC